MKLTIVVTVLNEKNTIIQAIDDAKSLNVDKEIIVIDNCSTDGTVELLKDLKDNPESVVNAPISTETGRVNELKAVKEPILKE